MDKPTKMLVWMACGVVIVAGGIFIANELLALKEPRKAGCIQNEMVQTVCLYKGSGSKPCQTAIEKCSNGQPLDFLGLMN